MKKSRFTVTGMSCAACSASVERSVSALDGVQTASVNLASGKLTVTYDEDKLCAKDIEFAVTKIGFGVNYDNFRTNMENKTKQTKAMKRKLITSAVFVIPLFYISMGYMLGLPVPSAINPEYHPLNFAIAQIILAVGCMIAGYKFYTNGIKSLITGKPNMDTLVCIGTGAAFIYGIILTLDMHISGSNHSHNLYFESVGVIITLIMLGKFLENKSKLRTNDAIVKLMELTPKTATVIQNGEKKEVDVDSIKPGDIVAIMPGARIPVDGVVVKGNTNVDESMLTGEGIPVEKEPGSKIFAGCINKYGYIEVQCTVSMDNTVISQIVDMVEDASGSKPQIAHMADKICGIFVPVVISIAILTAIIWVIIGKDIGFAMDRFISVMVVACPCALGLATPTAVIVSVGRAASEGILIKDAQAIELLNSVDTFVFDKTGTLTVGEPKVTDFRCEPDFDSYEVLSYAMSAEAVSEHPLSDAVYEYALSHNAEEKEIESFNAVMGGIRAVINGKTVLLGNIRLMKENNISGEYEIVANEYVNNGKTAMIISIDGVFAGTFAAGDTLKEESHKTVTELNRTSDTVLLTGDNALVANAMAKELGIKNCISEVLPNEKADKINELRQKGKRVAMVGDGINDSVALTVADVGIAVGSGTQIALESADIVIMKDDLYDIIEAKEISRATMKNIRQNLFYAFAYNTLLIPVAAGVFSFAGIYFNPMLAATAMALSSVSVVLNALRLKKKKYKEKLI